jgi:CheY-like chemotaxis protein
MALALDLSGVKALLLEDDGAFRRILHRTLSEWNADVHSVEGGALASADLKQARDRGSPYRLIVLDTTMAGVNGFEVAARLEEHPEELRGVILLLGRNPRRQEMDRAATIGIGGYLVKPFTRAELLKTIGAALGVSSATKPPEVPPNRSLRVLLAEDSPDTQRIIRHYLDRPDVQIDSAENGAIALEHFRLAEYDVVLMDIQMPVFDGYLSMQQMRGWERQHGLRRVPIIAITAYAETEDAQKCLRAGFDGYLTKPLQREKLVAAIRRHGKRSFAG